MSRPTWITPEGSLGTIQEQEYYVLPMVADAGGSDMVYSLIAGKLPDGLIIRRNGTLEGRPTSSVKIAGIPQGVSRDITSRFALRVSADGFVSDRTFSVTVTGQDTPLFSTNAGRIGTFIDGTEVDLQIQSVDPDMGDTVTYSLLSGELPPGLTMSDKGRITGFTKPVVATGALDEGYDDTLYDQYGFDFTNNFLSKSYQFTVAITDGKDTASRTFEIYIVAATSQRASSTVFTADMTNLSADGDTRRPPVIRNTKLEYLNVLHNNDFFLEVDGFDYDNDAVVYSLQSGSLPNGLSLNTTTGWITGSLPSILAIDETYNFTVRIAKLFYPEYFTQKTFKLVLSTSSDITPTWDQEELLGSVYSGEPSTLAVSVTSPLNEKFSYRIKGASKSGLPQGLTLQNDGTIVGVPTFRTFSMDSGTTTYDKQTTTWDSEYSFTIQAVNNSSVVRAEKTFKLLHKNENYKPYENVYLVQQSSKTDRDLWKELTGVSDTIPYDDIYRPHDPFFGFIKQPRVLLAHGLNPKLSVDYIKILQKNFYKFRLQFGELKYARAVDPNSNKHIYDVVYAQIIDPSTETNSQGKMVAGNLTITANSASTISNYSAPLQVDETTSANTNLITADTRNKIKLYPSGFEIIRNVLINNIGQVDSRVLPLWMRSTQEDDTTLGFVPSAPLMYVKPGLGPKTVYNLINNPKFDLDSMNFIVDRLLWDNSRSDNFNKDTQTWDTINETTFDSDGTTFESGKTGFFAGVDKSENSWDEGDQYLKFPRETIMDTPN